jgi:hypothetical protein
MSTSPDCDLAHTDAPAVAVAAADVVAPAPAAAHVAAPASISVVRTPACTRFRLTDFLDSKQRFIVYNVAHYEGSPRVPRDVPDVHPSARFLGCYATRDTVIAKAQSIMENTDGFALRVTPTFQFDVLCADQMLSATDRRARVLRVLGTLRARKEQDAREMQERATRAHTERVRTNAVATSSASASARVGVEGGRAQKLTVHLQEYNWELLETLAPSASAGVLDSGSASGLFERAASASVAAAAAEEKEEKGDGEGRPVVASLDDCEVPVTQRRAGQTHLLLSLIEDEDHPDEPVFLAYKASDNEAQIERWMKDIGELFAPLNVYSVPLYEFGPLSGFEESLTLDDKEYERGMNAHRPGLIAANEDDLRDRIRREFRMDPDGDNAIWIRPGEEVKQQHRRVFELRSVTVKTLDDAGNVTKVEQLPSSSWRYLDDAELRNLPRSVQDVRDLADGKLSALSEAMTQRSHAAATSLLTGRDDLSSESS